MIAVTENGVAILVAIIGALAILIPSLLTFAANRKTRRMNTSEHESGSRQRIEMHELTMVALKELQGDVHGVSARLDDHTNMLVHHVTDVAIHQFAS